MLTGPAARRASPGRASPRIAACNSSAPSTIRGPGREV